MALRLLDLRLGAVLSLLVAVLSFLAGGLSLLVAGLSFLVLVAVLSLLLLASGCCSGGSAC